VRAFSKLVLLCLSLLLVSASVEFPPLPSKGFMHGRAAKLKDVKNHSAVFVLDRGEGTQARPLAIEIPQYARIKKSGEYAIVVQAEVLDGLRLVGLRTFNGGTMVALMSEVKLLGRHPPRKP
jgi:hypothetical protein